MMSDGFLHRYFVNNVDKRLHKWLHYFDIYERHFARFRDKKPTIVEIGVAGGGSLAMWKAYFGEGARIVGIDIDPACKQHEAESIDIFIGSQDDDALLATIRQSYPRIDIVLDDGSHLMPHMIKTFEVLYPHVDPHGVYMVEDTHTCYWPKYGAGVKKAGSFMEYVKDRLDDINAFHAKGALPITGFTRTTESITTYDSVVVFEKRPQGLRSAPITAAMPDQPPV